MSTRILVVDDDTALSEMIGIMLTAEGYEPSYCADGATTIDVFHKSDPDLVLLDLMLPGVDGVEICRWAVWGAAGVPGAVLGAGCEDHGSAAIFPASGRADAGFSRN